MRLPVAILATAVLCSSGLARTQEQGDQIQLGANLVEVRAVVTDSKGAIVTGLQKADFDVLDGGLQQDVAFFAEQRVSSERTAGSPVVSASNSATTTPAEPAVRTVVLFVDDYHLSANSLSRVRVALKEFVTDELTDRDLLGLFSASGRVRMFGQFGRDRTAVLAAIDAIPFTPPPAWPDSFTPLLAARIRQNDQRALDYGVLILQRKYNDFDPHTLPAYVTESKSLALEILQEEASWRTATLDTIRNLCDQLGGMPGQRLILMYSDGFPLRDRDGTPTDTDLRAVISHAARAGVVVSAVIATGLSADSGTSASERYNLSGDGYPFQIARATAEDALMGPGAVAKQTGGVLYTDTNDIEKLGRETLERNSDYYALAYYSPDPAGTTFREVEVRLRNHPEYTVRAQNGYVPVERRTILTPSKDPKVRLIESLVRPILPTDLDVALDFAGLSPVKGKSQVALKARVAGPSLDLKDVGGGRYPLNLDVTTVVYDLGGSPVFVGSDHISGILMDADAEAFGTAVFDTLYRSHRSSLVCIRFGSRFRIRALVG